MAFSQEPVPEPGLTGGESPEPTAGTGPYQRRPVRTLRWWDGLVLSMAVPAFLFPSLGPSVAALGAVGAAGVWTASVIVGSAQGRVYAEMATMFPGKSGGIGVYAHEGFRRRVHFLGPLAIWGYWFGWSAVLSINGLLVGDYLQALFWPSWDPLIVGPLVGTVMLVALWGFNALGLRPGIRVAYVLGALTTVPMAIIMAAPFLGGTFHPANLLPLSLPGGVPWVGWGGEFLLLQWMFVAGWSAYAMEAMATFAPEYRDTARDTPRALRSASLFSTAVYAIVPIGLVGVLGQQGVQANPYTAFDPALRAILGPGVGLLVVLVVVASLVLSANVATMDGSRALWQMARNGLTIRPLGRLSRRGVPTVAMTLDLAVQVALLWMFPSSPLFILAASNVGYIFCHVAALSAFVLLRRDRPGVARPLRLGRGWVPLAGGLATFDATILVVGAPVYGTDPFLTGLAILSLGVVLYYVALRLRRRSGRRRRHSHPLSRDL